MQAIAEGVIEEGIVVADIVERFKRILSMAKLARGVHVINDPLDPAGKIFLSLDKFEEDTPENRMIAGIELSPYQAKRLYKELGNKIRNMERVELKKGEDA